MSSGIEKCEFHKNVDLINDCQQCGAPVCCPTCCKEMDDMRKRNYEMSADAGTIQKWVGYTIYCSACTNTEGTGSVGDNSTTFKHAALVFREVGWVKRKGEWLCPDCVAKLTPICP